jgi:type VI protein secretion system component Hcp
MYLDAAVMDMEEALRTLTMIGTRMGQLDWVMLITGKNQGPIQGESKRKISGGEFLHPILGHYLAAGGPTDSASGQASGRRRYSAMRVIRSSDSSTSPFMSAFAKNEEMTVRLYGYRAGGDDSEDAMHVHYICLEKARIKTFTLLCGGAFPNTGAVEIIEFAFRHIEMHISPQDKTGSSGPGKVFLDTLESK